MRHTIHTASIRRSSLKQTVFVLALLAAVNAVAATPDSGTGQSAINEVQLTGNLLALNEQVVGFEQADPYEAIKRKSSARKNATYSTTSKARPVDSERVFKDDYERLLVKVGSAKNTEMIWLSRTNAASD
jgi:hypothetical protein